MKSPLLPLQRVFLPGVLVVLGAVLIAIVVLSLSVPGPDALSGAPAPRPLPSELLGVPDSPLAGPAVGQDAEADAPAADFQTPELDKEGRTSLWRAFSEVRRQVEALTPEQAAHPRNRGAQFFAQNPSQALTMRFLDQHVLFQPGQEGQDWQAMFSAVNLPAATELVASGTRVEYVRGTVIEWFENHGRGVEQGFIVTSPLSQDGTLRVDVAVEGLTVRAVDDDAVELVDGEGRARLSYAKIVAWDADRRLLPARLEATERGIGLLVADSGARYPVTIDPFITATPNDTGGGNPGSRFGHSMALSGTTALIGVPLDSRPAGSNFGSAYVFTSNKGRWTMQYKLAAYDAAPGDEFGGSVALSGETALVGAALDDNEGGTDAGSAYFFTRASGRWSEPTKLLAADGAANDLFGCSIALSGATALIGARSDDTPGGANAGSAYVFALSGTTWTQQARLFAGDGAANDNFGVSVALSGLTSLIGANADDTASGIDAGSAYVFLRSGAIWTFQSKLTAPDAAADDQFGHSVALSGETLLVGAPYDDIPSYNNAGSSHVFVRTGGSWSHQQKLTAPSVAPADSWFGWAVALSGETAVIGAPREFGGWGAAYVFGRSRGTWSSQGRLSGAIPSAGDSMGQSVAISGSTALVGASLDDVDGAVDAGSATIFVRGKTEWLIQSVLSGSDAAPGDALGESVALFENTALVGAPNDDTERGIDSGSAYAFLRGKTGWVQSARLIAPGDTAGDKFGASVALSKTRALVGAPFRDYSGNVNTGEVIVFLRAKTSWWPIEGSLNDYRAAPAAEDRFGASVALVNNTALVGAPLDDNARGGDAGSAYVFDRTSPGWEIRATLNASNGNAADKFGSAVALAAGRSGHTAVIGAPGDNTAGGTDAGSAYVFVQSGLLWTEQANLTASDGAAIDAFGTSVAVFGDRSLIGAPNDDGIRGAAYLFTRSGATWSQQPKLTASPRVVGDEFGASVAVSAVTEVIGAPGQNGPTHADEGSAHVFRGGSFVTTLIVGSTSPGYRFGQAVGISGNTVIVGCPGSDTGAGVNAGEVYIWTLAP